MESSKEHNREADKLAITSRPHITYNPYFFIPFMIWVLLGGIAIMIWTRQELFSAINTRHTTWGNTIMYFITSMGEGFFSLFVIIVLAGFKRLRNGWYFVAALFTNALPSLIVQAIKSSVNAPRPLNYFKEAPWIHTLPEWPRLMERSFPSGHSCAAFCLFCFISFFLPYGYRKWALLFFVLALLVGFSRIYLAAHFFHDIYVGSIIGTTFTLAIMYMLEHYRGFFFRYVPKQL